MGQYEQVIEERRRWKKRGEKVAGWPPFPPFIYTHTHIFWREKELKIERGRKSIEKKERKEKEEERETWQGEKKLRER